MEITDIKLRKINPEGKMKAVLSVTFDNEFVVHDIKVIEANNKLFAAMPNRKDDQNSYRDVAHPINGEMRDKLQNAVLEEYSKNIEKGVVS